MACVDIEFTALGGFLWGRRLDRARMRGAAEWDVLSSELAERFPWQF